MGLKEDITKSDNLNPYSLWYEVDKNGVGGLCNKKDFYPHKRFWIAANKACGLHPDWNLQI